MATFRVRSRVRELIAAKEAREGRRITRRDIAEEMGVTVGTVQRWATNNTQRYDAPVILGFCQYFGCTVSELIIIEEMPNSGQRKSLYAVPA